jgi:hypothetical protein
MPLSRNSYTSSTTTAAFFYFTVARVPKPISVTVRADEVQGTV